MIVDLSESAGQQEAQAFGSDGWWQGLGEFTVAARLDAVDKGAEHLADGCHGILARRLMLGGLQDPAARALARLDVHIGFFLGNPRF